MKNTIKTFNIRIPKDLWVFLSKKSIDRELSMNKMLIELIKKYKNKCEKKVD